MRFTKLQTVGGTFATLSAVASVVAIIEFIGEDDPVIVYLPQAATEPEAMPTPFPEPEPTPAATPNRTSATQPAAAAQMTETPLAPTQKSAPGPATAEWVETDRLEAIELRPLSVCGDRFRLNFTVAKAGSRAGDAIYLKTVNGSEKISVGETIQAAPDCRLKLDRTGQKSNFFAVFIQYEVFP